MENPTSYEFNIHEKQFWEDVTAYDLTKCV